MSDDRPVDLRAVVEFAHGLAYDCHPPPLLAFVRVIELSPGICHRLKRATEGSSPALARAAYDGTTLYGIEVRQNGALTDPFAVLRFGDGRVGLWDMRGTEVQIIGGKA